MKQFQNLGISLVGLLPIFYVAGYFGFLAWAKPAFQKEFKPFGDTITVVTQNRPIANAGATLFKPAMAMHAKVSGAKFTFVTANLVEWPLSRSEFQSNTQFETK